MGGRLTTTFTTKASLTTAVKAYNTDPTAAIATYGPIADWDVSVITDMSYLFNNLQNFDEDVSSWDTSSVTDMSWMFYVRSAHALAPPAFTAGPSRCACRSCAAAGLRPPASRPTPRSASYAHISTWQGANALSDANKLLIRCAWAGTSAFSSAGYGSWWGSGSCT